MEGDVTKVVKKYRPVAVTASKVGEIGVGQDKQDILKLDVPADDAGLFIQNKQEDNSQNKQENTISKDKQEEKTNNDERDDYMEKDQIRSLIKEELGEDQLNKNVDEIKANSENTNSKVGEIEDQIKGINEIIKHNSEFLDKQYDETCKNGQCNQEIKDNLSKQASDIIDANKFLANEVAQLKESLNSAMNNDYAQCAGKKGCGHYIKVGSSFCPNCGQRIKRWPDHPEWVPYWERTPTIVAPEIRS